MSKVDNKVEEQLNIKDLEVSYQDAKNHHDEAIIAIPKIIKYMITRGLEDNIIDIDSEYNEKMKALKTRKKKVVKKKKEEKYKIITGKFSVGNGIYKNLDYTKKLKEVEIKEILIDKSEENKKEENIETNDQYTEIANNKLQLIKKNTRSGLIDYLINMKNCILEKF